MPKKKRKKKRKRIFLHMMYLTKGKKKSFHSDIIREEIIYIENTG